MSSVLNQPEVSAPVQEIQGAFVRVVVLSVLMGLAYTGGLGFYSLDVPSAADLA